MAAADSLESSDPRRRLGAMGERLARRHLEARGLRVLDANFRTRNGELDLVAADALHLVFCEVKTRMVAVTPGPAGAARVPGIDGPTAEPDPGARPEYDELGPFAAIGTQKRRRLRRMAREWLSERGRNGPWRPELRFDAIGIEFDRQGRLRRLEHVEGAF